MTHADELNRRIRKAGLVWHPCAGCGRDWPFPMGVPVDDSPETHEHREWICVVCANAEERRTTPLLKRYLDNHCQNADAEGMSARCECRLCLATRKAIGL